MQIVVLESGKDELSTLVENLKNTITVANSIEVLQELIDFEAIEYSSIQDFTKIHRDDEIVLLGPKLALENAHLIPKLKANLNKTELAVLITDKVNIDTLKSLTKLGIEYVIEYSFDVSRELREFKLLNMILCITASKRIVKRGRLVVVDGSKGNIGVSTISAAIADQINKHKTDVVLLDLDYESQDLSRYLRVKPFINEQLEIAISSSLTITSETIDQIITRVWDNESLKFVTPAKGYQELLKADALATNQLFKIIELIDSNFGLVILDLAGMPSFVAQRFYEIADDILFLIPLDATSIHCGVSRLNYLLSHQGDSPRINLLPVQHRMANSISHTYAEKYFEKITKANNATWYNKPLPFCKSVALWPGTGKSPLDCCQKAYSNYVAELCHDLELSKDHDNSFVPRTSFSESIIKIFNFAQLINTIKNKINFNNINDVNKDDEALPNEEYLLPKGDVLQIDTSSKNKPLEIGLTQLDKINEHINLHLPLDTDININRFITKPEIQTIEIEK